MSERARCLQPVHAIFEVAPTETESAADQEPVVGLRSASGFRAASCAPRKAAHRFRAAVNRERSAVRANQPQRMRSPARAALAYYFVGAFWWFRWCTESRSMRAPSR